jgi:hypothetical protein
MGKAKRLIDELIEKKAQGNKLQISNIKMKLMFKGVMPDEITHETVDTEDIINRIVEVAKDFNIQLSSN